MVSQRRVMGVVGICVFTCMFAFGFNRSEAACICQTFATYSHIAPHIVRRPGMGLVS